MVFILSGFGVWTGLIWVTLWTGLFGEFGKGFGIDDEGGVWWAMGGAEDVVHHGFGYLCAAMVWPCADDEELPGFEACGGVEDGGDVWGVHGAGFDLGDFMDGLG